MTNWLVDIQAAVRDRGYAVDAEVQALLDFAETNGSPGAFSIAGDLIQLLNESDLYELQDAEKAYQRAIAIDPAFAKAHASLGYYCDAILDDPRRALPFFERAIALGDADARAGLEAVLEQLADQS